MEEECTSSLHNNAFTTINTQETRQLRVKPIGSKLVYKTKHNPDGTMRYKTCVVIKGYEQMDFAQIYAAFGKLSTVQDIISVVGLSGWNIDYVQFVAAFPNLEVDNDDIYMTLGKVWLEDRNAPTNIV